MMKSIIFLTHFSIIIGYLPYLRFKIKQILNHAILKCLNMKLFKNIVKVSYIQRFHNTLNITLKEPNFVFDVIS